MCDIDKVEEIFSKHNINIVVHFAAFKSVSESISNPTLYYYNNINSTTNLLKIMRKYDCNNLIFSSSATIYGYQKPPFVENMNNGTLTNPYGFTKIIENILEDNCKYDNKFKIMLLDILIQ